jgi:peptidoglycan/xylan/chitin deacetylase (PgdA/CDA1 family)
MFISDIRIYFDDGYESFFTTARQHLPKALLDRIILAIPPELLDNKGHLSREQLHTLATQKVHICSHGYSHAALAVYRNNQLQCTPRGGTYKNAPFGQGEPLTSQEIMFQYEESKRSLEKITKTSINEFAFPFGLYNPAVIELNTLPDKKSVYDTLSACDDYLDDGGPFRTRYLVSNTQGMDFLLEKIRTLLPLEQTIREHPDRIPHFLQSKSLKGTSFI